MSVDDKNFILAEIEEETFPDESNESREYLRNKIRLDIIPLLKEIGFDPDKIFENFHEDSFDSSIPNETGIPSFLKIDNSVPGFLNTSSLKELIDLHLRVLKCYPLTKNIVLELTKELKKNSAFTIENPECIFWKSPTSPLFLIPKSSPVLKSPVFIQSKEESVVKWNQMTLSIQIGLELKTYADGLKIKTGTMHKLISEVLREKQVPAPIREKIPILFKNGEPYQILFEMFDENLANYPKTKKD